MRAHSAGRVWAAGANLHAVAARRSGRILPRKMGVGKNSGVSSLTTPTFSPTATDDRKPARGIPDIAIVNAPTHQHSNTPFSLTHSISRSATKKPEPLADFRLLWVRTSLPAVPPYPQHFAVGNEKTGTPGEVPVKNRG